MSKFKPLGPRFAFFVFSALLSGTVFPFITGPGSELHARPADGLHLSLALGIGNHRPDLEDKFFNDRYFGAVFVGGFGVNTAWEEKNYLNLLPSAEYRRGRWLFELDFTDIESSPSFIGYTAASSLTVLDLVSYRGLVRNRRSLIAGYLLNPRSKNHLVHLLGGLGRIKVESDASVFRAVTIGVSASALGVSAGNRTNGTASGALLGIAYRYEVSKTLEFEARWLLGTMSGKWSSREAFAFTFPSVGFRLEDGDYYIMSSQVKLSVEYKYTSELTFFASFENESAIHGDSDVILITDTIISDPSTYTRDALLSFGGSSQSEFISGFRVGARYRLDL